MGMGEWGDIPLGGSAAPVSLDTAGGPQGAVPGGFLWVLGFGDQGVAGMEEHPRGRPYSVSWVTAFHLGFLHPGKEPGPHLVSPVGAGGTSRDQCERGRAHGRAGGRLGYTRGARLGPCGTHSRAGLAATAEPSPCPPTGAMLLPKRAAWEEGRGVREVMETCGRGQVWVSPRTHVGAGGRGLTICLCHPGSTVLAGVNTGLFHSDGSGSEGRRRRRRRRGRRRRRTTRRRGRRTRKMSPVDLSFLFSSQHGGRC